MRLFRFMCEKEFEKLIDGETLVNNKNHKGNTGSKGFCFMEYEMDRDIQYSYEYLSGIVDDDVVVVFETDNKNVNDSWGIYADPYGSFFATIIETEYCTTTYNKDTFKILKYGLNLGKNSFELDIKWCDTPEELLNLAYKRTIKEKQKKQKTKRQQMCIEKIMTGKEEELQNFIGDIRDHKNDMEFKINGNYYKVDGDLTEISGDTNYIMLTFNVYIKR